MTTQSDYVTGTISLTNGSVDFTGTATGWLAAGFQAGDTIIDITGATEYMAVIATIDANGAGTLTKAWEGPTLVDVAYRMRYQPDGSRVTAQARNLIELLGNGNLQAMAGLSGSANQVLMFTGPGAMITVPKTDLVSGANYDVQVADLAARAAYDGQDEGFAVLVADTGDGRAAIYSKNSNTSGDWSDPAYVTGQGYDLSIGTVDEVPYGTAPTVNLTPGPGGGALNFEIPAGMIIEPGSVTTLAPGEAAAIDFVPVTGGYRLDFSLPKGDTGDINGVTPFWQTRITQDADAAAARNGLGLPDLLADKWAFQPIGVPIPLQSNLTGVTEPPTDNALYRYIKFTASDAYNSGVLISESVSGSAPLVQATAVIDDAESPLDGQTVRLINTERRVFRAGSAGTVQNDQMQQITGQFRIARSLATSTAGAFSAQNASQNAPSAGGGDDSFVLFDSANSPNARTGNETRSKNIGVDYYMRIK